jgi:uncharacterized protein
MKIGKLIIGILILAIFGCKSNHQAADLNKNPIVQKNQTEYDGIRFRIPTGFVSDFEKIFTIEQRQILEKRLTEYEKSTTREFVIITTDSIKPYANIKDYSTDLLNDWAIGKNDTNNGLAIVFSKKLKEIRISTGLGTEKILTDEICKNIIDQTIIPEFKKGNFYIGIDKAITELMTNWK